MRILFELHGLKQRRALQNLRAEMEEGTRRKVEAEVGYPSKMLIIAGCIVLWHDLSITDTSHLTLALLR